VTGKQLKYVRTAQGFIVFPCLAATHKMMADATGWPKVSAGFVDWDFDGRPLCMGESESLGMKSKPEDTELLRAEWGMGDPVAAPAPPAFAAVREFCKDLTVLGAS
jgi:hypothetical protein